jgi:hypothetical protein
LSARSLSSPVSFWILMKSVSISCQELDSIYVSNAPQCFPGSAIRPIALVVYHSTASERLALHQIGFTNCRKLASRKAHNNFFGLFFHSHNIPQFGISITMGYSPQAKTPPLPAGAVVGWPVNLRLPALFQSPKQKGTEALTSRHVLYTCLSLRECHTSGVFQMEAQVGIRDG